MLRSQSQVRAILNTSREQYNDEDAVREAALDAVVAAVSQGPSEHALDDRVAEALEVWTCSRKPNRVH